MPVNLRPLEKAYKLGNRFGLVFLDLPIGIDNPIERLYAVRANMQALKGSYQPVLALGMLAAMGAGPKVLQEQLLALLARNATAVMTNVPGPQQPLFLAGASIDSLMFWVPQSGDIGIGVSILSYDGAVQFGVISDRRPLPRSRSADRALRSRVREAGAGDAAGAVAVDRAAGRADDGERAVRRTVARAGSTSAGCGRSRSRRATATPGRCSAWRKLP